jgi:streptomycin 6-kinase
MKSEHENTEELIGLWNLRSLEPLTKTSTADLYCCLDEGGSRHVLKVFTAIGARDEGLGKFFLERNPQICVKLVNYNSRALLMEFIEGDDLYSFSKSNREALATEVFINLLARYNKSSHHGDSRITSVRDLYSVFRLASLPKELEPDIKKAGELAQLLGSREKNEILLHGDVHHENIIGSEASGFYLIDPKGLMGEIEYELGTTLKNPWSYPSVSHCTSSFEQRLTQLCKGLGFEREKVLSYTFIHLCLSICWSIQSNSDYSHQKGVLNLVKKHL